MSTTTAAAASSSLNALQSASSTTSAGAAAKPYDAKAESDKFMKLLVTQLQNQDPLNPMDNAQVTSQLAQINTVQGINTLNGTMTDVSGNIAQMQMLQGAALVGHKVELEGNKLYVDSTGKASGAYELSSAATAVNIDILNSAGVKIDSIKTDAMATGRHSFNWNPPSGTDASKLTFKVTANQGGQNTSATTLMSDTIDAVSSGDGKLTLKLRANGDTAYSMVKSVS